MIIIIILNPDSYILDYKLTDCICTPNIPVIETQTAVQHKIRISHGLIKLICHSFTMHGCRQLYNSVP